MRRTWGNFKDQYFFWKDAREYKKLQAKENLSSSGNTLKGTGYDYTKNWSDENKEYNPNNNRPPPVHLGRNDLTYPEKNIGIVNPNSDLRKYHGYKKKNYNKLDDIYNNLG